MAGHPFDLAPAKRNIPPDTGFFSHAHYSADSAMPGESQVKDHGKTRSGFLSGDPCLIDAQKLKLWGAYSCFYLDAKK